MLYQKKRRKLNLADHNEKQNEDSTRNSDRVASSQRNSQLGINKKKSSTKLFIKRTLNQQSSQKNSSQQKAPRFAREDNHTPSKKMSQTQSNYFDLNRMNHEQLSTQKDQSRQKFTHSSNTASTCSLQPNNDQGLNNNRKKFKLYCQVKKKKQTEKKSDYEKETERFAASSTVSESWIKNSIFSRTSQKQESSSTNKSKDKRQRSSKINLTQKIRQIKSKQKERCSLQKDEIQTPKTLDLQIKDRDNITKSSQQNSKRSKKSHQKKHSTVNIKRSVILEKLMSEKQKQSRIQISVASSLQQNKEPTKLKQIQNSNKKPNFNLIQNKILPQDSQIIEESVKKLSQIKEQKNEDTISRSLKVAQLNYSKSKDIEQTSMHLSINSICKDHRRSFGCILQTTELRESALRREIQSSLSELQKSRQIIDIKKFQGLKNIAELASQISEVEHNMTVIQKIEFHIELINTLSNFVYKSTELEYLMEDWDELNFLIYKKFYLERMKVLNFLKKYPIKNPFCIKRASIETKQVLKALRENEFDIKRIKNTLQIENATIKKNLEVFYNQFSKQQHGEKINLFEYDNFSHWIFKELWDEIQLFSYSQSHNQLQLEDRICKSLQAGFLISQLNGNYVTPFEDAQIASRHNRQKIYIDDNLKVFQRYVLNKKK